MPQESFNDLYVFSVVATERSFTKAAAKLGVSQSALSHAMRNLEARLGLRLLERTTRSVAPTEAGERLMAMVKPRFTEIEDELALLTLERERPGGTIRITASEHCATSYIGPALVPLLQRYPDIKVEVNVDAGMTDIVAERFDAGVRLGDRVAKDMIAVRISPMLRWVVAGTPAYFERHPAPQTPQDLAAHNCINIRFPTHGDLFAWDFQHDGQDVKVRVDGQLTFNSMAMRLQAALAGSGLAYLPHDVVEPHRQAGRLVTVLEDWCPPGPGYHLYYSSRHYPSKAFSLMVDALRYEGPR